MAPCIHTKSLRTDCRGLQASISGSMFEKRLVEEHCYEHQQAFAVYIIIVIIIIVIYYNFNRYDYNNNCII